MDEIKVTRLINGPEAFTPDNEFCLGESEVRGFFVAAGFCAHGLAGAGGIGKRDGRVDPRGRAVARRLGDGHPPLRAALPLARATRSSARSEVYETYYDIRYPGHERQAGRPLRTSSAYPWHAEHGAAFGEKSGWERVNWYEPNAADGRRVAAPARLGGDALVAGDRRRAPRHARARGAVRRVLVRQARDRRARARPAFLEGLCDNRVAREVGAITYTQMLNRRGGIECDFTVTRVEEELFSIVTGTAFGNHDLSWIRRHAPDDGSVRCADVTARWACFALWGPRARDDPRAAHRRPLDFPYMRMRELAVGDVPVRALRVTFVGELGWELYCPTEYGAGLWRTLWEAGREHGLVAGGYRAIDSLRLEKGYRVWAADITPDETPLEAGLGFCVQERRRLHRPRRAGVGGGRSPRRSGACAASCSTTRARSRSATSPCASTARSSAASRAAATATRSSARSPTPTCRPSSRSGTPVEVDIFGEWVAGEVAAEPLFDPRGERIRA